MSDVEAPAVVHVNTDEKKDDSSSSDGNWSYTAGGSRDPDDMVRRLLKQRHIQMWVPFRASTHGLNVT